MEQAEAGAIRIHAEERALVAAAAGVGHAIELRAGERQRAIRRSAIADTAGEAVQDCRRRAGGRGGRAEQHGCADGEEGRKGVFHGRRERVVARGVNRTAIGAQALPFHKATSPTSAAPPAPRISTPAQASPHRV